MATLEELQQELSALKSTKNKILTGAQEYSGMQGKISVKRADLSAISAEILDIERRIAIVKNNCQLSYSQAVFSGER